MFVYAMSEYKYKYKNNAHWRHVSELVTKQNENNKHINKNNI